MKRALFTMVGLIVLTLAGTGLVGWAQDEAQYDAWMKEVGETNSSLRENLESQMGDAAAADARRIVELLEMAQGFWQARNRSDAVQFATDAQAGLRQVADHAAAGRFEEAGAALRTAGSNCGSCHQTYRERAPDGSWRMKQL